MDGEGVAKLLLVATILGDAGVFPAFRVEAVGEKDSRSSNASSCCAVISSSSHVAESDEQSSLIGAVLVATSTWRG